MNLADKIVSIPDYPKPGIIFRDIWPLLQDGAAFHEATEQLAAYAKQRGATLIVGPEARGFVIGAPVAQSLGIGFAPARKAGKLPRETVSASYELEYGTNTLEMHTDSIHPGDKVLIIDDLLATGGTIKAVRRLVEQLGGEIVGVAFIIELVDLNGREQFSDLDTFSLIQYTGE